MAARASSSERETEHTSLSPRRDIQRKDSDSLDSEADSRLDNCKWSKCRGIQAASVSCSACEMFHRHPVEKYVVPMSGK